MTSSATRQGTDRTSAEREAWEVYRESLRDKDGMDYEEAERISWERLQSALRDLAGDGEELGDQGDEQAD